MMIALMTDQMDCAQQPSILLLMLPPFAQKQHSQYGELTRREWLGRQHCEQLSDARIDVHVSTHEWLGHQHRDSATHEETQVSMQKWQCLQYCISEMHEETQVSTHEWLGCQHHNSLKVFSWKKNTTWVH
jgi:hypothetical protein